MILLSSAPVLAAVALVLLALLVRSRGPQGELTETFVFVVTMMCFWNLNFFILYSVKPLHLAETLSRTFRTATLFLPPAILHLHLLLAFGQTGVRSWRPVLRADYLIGTVLAIANAFDLLVRTLKPMPWGYASVGTAYYHVFTVFMLTNAMTSLVVVTWQISKTSDARTRQQLKFWLIGAAIALPMGLMNLLPAYGVAIYPPGSVGTAVWAGIVAYAIIRHRLLGIEVVVTKTLAYATVATLLISPAFALGLLIQKQAFGEIHTDFSIGMFILLVAVGLLFPKVTTWAESRVESSLFREKREAHRALSLFAQSVIRIFDKKQIVSEVCQVVASAFGASATCVYLSDSENKGYSLREVVGTRPNCSFVSRKHPFVDAITRGGGPMLRSEIEMVLSLQEAGVADVLADESWEVVVPLIGPTHLLGILCLGAKTAREAYSAGDLQVLGRVGAEATFALENARLYEELRRSQQLIDRAARLSALGTLAAGIAHEVRNPLVSIQTFFQLAPERLHDDEFMTSFLKLAEEEVDRIRNLISELLSFARSSEATMQNVTVQDVIGRIVVLMTPQAREKRISLIVDSLPIDPIVIQGDPDQLVQVLMNLVLNAIQATPENGYVRIDLKSVENEDELFCELVVSDTGPGISADVRESIFNPFFTTKESGTGLGLAMAYQIVSDYGGTIVVDVGAAEGASFRVRLPVTAEGRETLAPAVGAA